MAVGDGVSAIASLALTFGGFSPTAMDGVEATREHIERVQEAQARKRDADMRRRELERARASAPKRYLDGEGMTWTYVVMDESFVRIDSCKGEVEHVAIPAAIEGLPVRALGSDIFHESEIVTEIVCPDTVELIGSCAFRMLSNLRSIVFPDVVTTFSSSWLQHCPSLEDLVLPGLLDVITPAVFENQNLKRLVIGRAVMDVKPGSCEKTNLESVVIDSRNPFICTDGDAIYSHDMKSLIALARPVECYRIADGCALTCKKAFMGLGCLKEVTLPNTLETIGEFSFAHTGIVHIDIPGSVSVIQAKAFYHCSNLRNVNLAEGVKEIGDSAFAESALERILIPASIEQLGTSITANTNVVHSGSNVSFAVSPESKSLFFDGEGGLYRNSEDGVHFIQLVDPQESSYEVVENTVFIDEYAFAFHNAIEQVVLPEGVREIRKSAFRVCSNLRSVSFPESLKSIGKDAFLDTNLESVYLPKGFPLRFGISRFIPTIAGTMSNQAFSAAVARTVIEESCSTMPLRMW